MDVRDFALLMRIKSGERVFRPAEGGEAADDWLDLVERLLRLREKRLIRMEDPLRFYMTAEGGYAMAGPCDLTADGRDAVERHQGSA